jgi:hypothetical protein
VSGRLESIMSHPRKRGIHGINPWQTIPGLAVNALWIAAECNRMMSGELPKFGEEAPRFFAANQDTVVVIDRCVRLVHAL